MDTREIDLVVNLFNYYIEEAEVKNYDENQCLRTLREYNIRPNLFFRVAFDGLRPIGIIGGFLSEDPIESELSATVQFCYLLKDWATVENYGMLLEEFQRWAQAYSAKNIRAIDIGSKLDRLQSVYEDLGFDPIRISIMNKEIA